jgi:predicted RNA binding protein YcfA (HicA-like mRNA interferase family)
MLSATARDFQRVARLLGFSRSRTTGSHERWLHPDGRRVTIAIHGRKGTRAALVFQDSPAAGSVTGGIREVALGTPWRFNENNWKRMY